jgi:hypothetical protein
MTIGTTDDVGIGQVCRVQVWRIRGSRFQQQDATRVVCAQTIGEDCTSGTAADNQHIE